MTKRVAIYARYSSILQDVTSIEDQIRICKAYASSQGWTVVEIYTDKEISGQSAARPGYQRMLRDSESHAFDVVLAEAIDRLARRTADTTNLRDHLAYRGQVLFTVNYGEITPILAAVLGMIAEQSSKDTAAKTRRGQVGATHRGRVAAGVAYGYSVASGDGINRAVCSERAEIVIRIFTEFANGVAPAKIAAGLNADRIPGPRGDAWQSSTIRGNSKRGVGILRNRAYIGQIVYGQMRFRKDPVTGKRTSVAGEKPIMIDAPKMRIVPQELWDQVAQRLQSITREMATDPETGLALNRAHRKKFLLSGLLKCGCCGGNMAIMGKDRYGCSIRKRKGTCQNATTITRDHVEGRVLASLKRELLKPSHMEAFCALVTKEVTAKQRSKSGDLKSLEKKINALDTKIARILDQIEDGVGHSSLLLERLGSRQDERAALAAEREAIIVADASKFVMPNLSTAYRGLVSSLEDRLRDPAVVQRAHEALAEMIEAIELRPDACAQHGYAITLRGDPAGIIGAYAGVDKEKLPDAVTRVGSQFSVVAGVGFEPTTFRL
ncbi:recombinase family protein [Parasedimentitalea denitrificans]|nr:recombinase family protein [Sedimentitalea sp. CY04]